MEFNQVKLEGEEQQIHTIANSSSLCYGGFS